ncbi:UNVERIFIED_CONTAM: protein OBERON 4 [Sesamum angustifolium]|uniref:Protein OBERON 4 n=1 Tax=Sesamum angustifolium TaxID=2727405 RepID=A0AAW2IMA9_9LAMI
MNSDRPVNIPIESRKELPTKNQEGASGIPGSSQGAGWLKSIYPDKAPRLENSVNLLPGFDSNRNDKYTSNMDLRKNSPKEPIFDELESIVRIKQAEAMMFQARADDARRESEALKRISVTKNERIEEEYTSRISKLRLAEAEEMRKQKVEELQALERAYQEYFNMKMRMETDIKDLLLKMEATRRNLST